MSPRSWGHDAFPLMLGLLLGFSFGWFTVWRNPDIAAWSGVIPMMVAWIGVTLIGFWMALSRVTRAPNAIAGVAFVQLMLVGFGSQFFPALLPVVSFLVMPVLLRHVR